MSRQVHPQLLLDHQVCFALYSASRLLTRAYAPLLEPLGLTYPQYLVMLALWETPDEAFTVGQVGTRLRLDTGTLTPLLKRLEALGLLTRRRDDADERRVLVSLTESGLALLDRAKDVPTRLAEIMQLSRPEGKALLTQLNTLIANLEAAAPQG